MSYRCNSCLYIFKDKKRSCPFCGGRIIENTCDESELFSEGFSYAPHESENQTQDRTNDSSDRFSKLYDSYVKEHFSSNSNATSCSTPPTETAENQFSNPVGADNHTTTSNSSDGYFGQFAAGTSGQSYSPVIEKPSSDSSTNASAYYNAEYEREMNRLQAQQRRLERAQRRLEFASFLHNISYRNLFRFLLVIFCAILLIVIWNKRFEIIDAITDLIVSLIPIAVLFGGAAYYIRKLFKK